LKKRNHLFTNFVIIYNNKNKYESDYRKIITQNNTGTQIKVEKSSQNLLNFI